MGGGGGVAHADNSAAISKTGRKRMGENQIFVREPNYGAWGGKRVDSGIRATEIGQKRKLKNCRVTVSYSAFAAGGVG